MKKLLLSLSIAVTCFLFSSCNMATPEQYFDRAVLNSNLLVSFATPKMVDRVKVEGTIYDADKKERVLPRKEAIGTEISTIENALKKIKDLKPTDETKDMLATSIQLHEMVLPVYKNEYMQLAEAFDKKAPESEINAIAKNIEDKYAAKFEETYAKLITLGKAYAAKNNIKVNWGL